MYVHRLKPPKCTFFFGVRRERPAVFFLFDINIPGGAQISIFAVEVCERVFTSANDVQHPAFGTAPFCVPPRNTRTAAENQFPPTGIPKLNSAFVRELPVRGAPR